jgi:hypothetical protein
MRRKRLRNWKKKLIALYNQTSHSPSSILSLKPPPQHEIAMNSPTIWRTLLCAQNIKKSNSGNNTGKYLTKSKKPGRDRL